MTSVLQNENACTWTHYHESNHAKWLPADLKAMDVDLHDQKTSIRILCGQPSKIELHIIANDFGKLTQHFVKGCLVHDERRTSDRELMVKIRQTLNYLDSLTMVTLNKAFLLAPTGRKEAIQRQWFWEKDSFLNPLQKGLISNTKSAEEKEESSNNRNVFFLVYGASTPSEKAPIWDIWLWSNIAHVLPPNLFEKGRKIAPPCIKTGDDLDVNAKCTRVRCYKNIVSGFVQKL